MTAIIAFFTTTAIGRALAKIGAVVLAVVTFGEYQRRKGRKAERADAKQEDVEHAQDIRDRVVTGRPDRLQSVKDRGYRD